MQEKSGEKLNIFSFSATSFIAMDRYESVDLFQAPVNSNNRNPPESGFRLRPMDSRPKRKPPYLTGVRGTALF